MTDIEEQKQDLENAKNLVVRVYLLSLSIVAVAGIYGYLTNSDGIMVVVTVVFVVSTMLSISHFSDLIERKKELEKEERIKNLEDKVERLEE